MVGPLKVKDPGGSRIGPVVGARSNWRVISDPYALLLGDRWLRAARRRPAPICRHSFLHPAAWSRRRFATEHYRKHAGLFADFHSCRHRFITNLERAGIRPKVAQTSARHSDIRMTLHVYTHAELADQTVAIGALPGPPGSEALRRRGRPPRFIEHQPSFA